MSSTVSAKSFCPSQLPLWVKISLSGFAISALVRTGYSLYNHRSKRIQSSTPSNPPPETVVPLLVAAKQINDQIIEQEKALVESEGKVEF